ncbi:hypothetical protein AVEN_202391-1 [Araneus ventricosus]|uniref:Uncharacterized protein n=1 Tax=Araneus ventricosus TaxID=182803 RepID=A0A4Y2IXC4_ARAVE|nr:hypothetical protein AVEN_202391-1 [Araneus ventricosus]
MSKHSRVRSHHSLHISDPRWATPTTTPLSQLKPTLPGCQTSCTDAAGPTETSTRTSCQYGLPNIYYQHHRCTTVSSKITSTKHMVAKYQQRQNLKYNSTTESILQKKQPSQGRTK